MDGWYKLMDSVNDCPLGESVKAYFNSSSLAWKLYLPCSRSKFDFIIVPICSYLESVYSKMSIYFHLDISTLSLVTHYYISNQHEVFTIWNIVLLRIYHSERKMFLKWYCSYVALLDLRERNFNFSLLTSAIKEKEDRRWVHQFF